MSDKKDQVEPEVILNDDDPFDDFLGGVEVPQEHIDAEMQQEKYPLIQWNNDERAWEFPLKYWGGSPIEENHEVVEVSHQSGQITESAFLLKQIHVSVIASRSVWERELEGSNRKEYSLRYEEGFQKRYNFFVFVKEAGDMPAVITIRSMTGEWLQSALDYHKRKVRMLAQKMLKRQYPAYMFYAPLVASESAQLVGKTQKSKIYPPIAAYNEDLSEQEILKELYIGNDLFEIVKFTWNEAQYWKEEFANGTALALPSPAPTVEIIEGELFFPAGLTEPKQWIEVVESIDGLFSAGEAASEFASFQRKHRQHGINSVDMWEAWKAELQEMYDEVYERQEAAAREVALRN